MSQPAFSQNPTQATGYRIVAGDVLQVDVVGRGDISGQFAVNKDGDITLPVVGAVNAVGRTTGELGNDVSRRISLVSRDIPQVTITVVSAYSRKHYILGAVLLPGGFSFSKAPTVWEAISEAGGPSEDADLGSVQIISEAAITPTIVDVATAVRSGDLGSLQRLRPGDTVRVPHLAGAKGGFADVVYVFGAVGTQGSQPLGDTSDLARILIQSGPMADANLSGVEIVRKGGAQVVSMKVNMRHYLDRARLPGNPVLQSGDLVYVSHKEASPNYLRIMGVVIGFAASVAILANNL